jgi:Putative Ig domain
MTGGLTTPPGAVVANGQLWVGDAALGFCRIAPNVNGTQTIVTTSCFATGTGQPAYDRVHNVVYVADAAGKTGMWRLQMSADDTFITTAVNILPGTSVAANFPTAAAMGPDGSLYIGLRASSTIFRLTNPWDDTPGAQQLQPVGDLQAGRGVSGLAFLNNDLWIADLGFLDRMSFATQCTGACTAPVVGGSTIPAGIVSDGTRYVYIGFGAEIVRYDDRTGTYDVASTGAISAGQPVGYGFIWGLGIDPANNALYLTTDVFGAAGGVRRARGAGAPPGTGSIFKLTQPIQGEGIVIDPLTLTQVSIVGPSSPLPVPLTGAAAQLMTNVSSVHGMAMIGSDLWVSDFFQGVCRVDPNPVTGAPTVSTTCAPTPPGFIPGQIAISYTTNPATGAKTPNHLFVADIAQVSNGVYRFDINAGTGLPGTTSLSGPGGAGVQVYPGTNRPSSVAIGSDGNLYIGLFNVANLFRVTTPDTSPLPDKNAFGITLTGSGVRSLAFIADDLYIAEATKTTVITFAPSRTKATPALEFGPPPVKIGTPDPVSPLHAAGVLSLASDGTDKLYMGGAIDTQAFSISVPQQYALANRGTDGVNETAFVNVTAAMVVGNTLYVADDPSGGTQAQQGRIWAVTLPWGKPYVPAYIMPLTFSDGSITLKWRDWSKLEFGFKIQRQDVPANPTDPLPAFVDVANVDSQTFGPAVGENSWTDTNVTPGATYNYQIASYDNSFQSVFTVPGTTVTALKLAPEASNLVANVISDSEVDLSWTDNSASETGFRVERAVDAAFTTGKTSITAPANATAAADTTTAGSTTYYYRVIAFNANGDSLPSNVVSITTPAPTQPPVITNPGNQTNLESNVISLQVLASDHVGGHNPLTFTATGLPSGLTINASTGLISGTVGALGTSNVTVSVANGPFSVSASFTWVVKGSLQPVSVTPSAGSGTIQVFQFTFSDVKGAADMKTLWLQINTSTNYPNSCAMTYDVAGKKLQIVKDDASGWQGSLTPGVAGTLANSQCSIDGATSSLTVSGNNLTLSLATTFKAGYLGLKNIYMRGMNQAGSDSGWQVMGTWTPAQPVAQAPSVASVTPNTGTGTAQTFQFVISDVNGYRFIKTAYAQISTSTAYPNSCAVMYDAVNNKLSLIRDDGTNWIGSITPGTATTLQNSQCALSGSGSSVSGAGTSITMNLALTFDQFYRGSKNIYGRALDVNNLDSGWQLKGTWTPTAVVAQAPSAVSATPNAGTGTVQTFQYAFSDVNGFRDLKTLWAQIATTTNYPGTCAINFDAVNNRLYLVKDDASGWLGPITPGTATSLSNSACTISGAGSSFTGSGANATLSVAYSFSATYTGAKTIFSRAMNLAGLDSGWQVKGSWTPQ